MTAQSGEKKTPIAQRAHKPNPLVQTRDAATKRRREMFFKRVHNSREDKKWETRGEQVWIKLLSIAKSRTDICFQIQQLDFVSERKRWEAEKARQAPPENDLINEDTMDDPSLPEWASITSYVEEGMTEADWIAAQEEYELQQLIASVEQENEASSAHYGSDDDDYDSIFLECLDMAHEASAQKGQHDCTRIENEDTMDMDMTDD